VCSSDLAITESAFFSDIKEKNIIEADIREILDLGNNLKELKNARNKIELAIVGLKPWTEYEIPLEIQETKYTYVSMGIVSVGPDVNRMRRALKRTTEQFELSLIAVDAEYQYVSLICMKDAEEAINEILKQYGFGRVFFKDLTGSVKENIARYESELIKIAKNIVEVEKDLADMVACKEAIQLLYDYLAVERDRAKAFSNVLTTERTFYIDGWVPAEESKNLENLLKDHGCHYEIVEPEKGEETPVLLKNNNFIAPIEAITDLYDVPNSREVDPTPIYAFFYLCFFGIMFADIGYGFLLASLSFAAVKTGKLEGNIYKFVKQLGYCGVSAFIWGIIFGSFFGNLITVVSETFFGKTVSIKPLWINPVENAMTMLLFSCVLGVIHLFVALGVKAYSRIREGKIMAAFNDAFLWHILITGLGLLLAGESFFAGAAGIGKWMSIAGAAGILLLPVFTGKGVGRLMGLWNLYGITHYLADVLSYARLLALCLAGSVLAQVFNMIASMFGGSLLGVIPFILIVVAAHVFNFLLSGLGAFVHSIRLQYVEFFGKFFEGKGTPFQPFMKNTKYVRIVREES
jgi:V/A-type H+-transporting ATPase subunit I